ncbi:MAG: phosphate acyltransferase PlsX [Spirochaetes bacterium]|nr:phosphate acyltransferase PlsX [Spirochaetota bacterium]
MKIAVDIMSGERSPEILIKGAVEAANKLDITAILVGEKNIIEQALKTYNYRKDKITFVHSSEVITMNEIPTIAIKQKPNASVFVAARLVKDGLADAFVSPGNTGATFAAAFLNLGRLKGVSRPAILGVMPKVSDKFTVILDVGANPECKPIHLVQFAAMGEAYASTVLGIDSPRIGLLSNGTELSKGTDITQRTYKILKKLPVNFIGYIEGRDIFSDEVDVAVCDGFTGNIVLKALEGVGKALLNILKSEINKSALSKLGAIFMMKSFNKIRKKVDYSEYGGAPLIGIDGTCIVTHGSSNDKEIMNGIKVASQMLNYQLNKMISNKLKEYHISKMHWFHREKIS